MANLLFLLARRRKHLDDASNDGNFNHSVANWEKGMPFSRYIDSALRHIVKYIMGMTDEDHLSAAVCQTGLPDQNDLFR